VFTVHAKVYEQLIVKNKQQGDVRGKKKITLVGGDCLV
jgi:hypothetical protein